MSKFTNAIALLALAASASFVSAETYPNVGRPATPNEIAAWDIDVRPDFKGLPKGSGTVEQGMAVWEGKCASCHGAFGESNEVFTPLIGGTTPEDIKTGRVAALKNGTQPQRTTIMKVATVSTLWDYINRAMPWTAPKSLSTEEVYSVVAYMLNMAEIVPDDFTLTDKNIAEVQQRMPNRNGMTTDHGMWDIKAKPDVQSVACMKNCKVEKDVRSTLPPSARNVHGNVAEQNRTFGPVRGADTTKPAPTAPLSAGAAATVVASAAPVAAKPATAKPATAKSADVDGLSLAKQYACVACHGISNKIIGPGFNQIAAKYKGDAGAKAALVTKVKKGTSGNWGPVPMPAQGHVKDADIEAMVAWILGSK